MPKFNLTITDASETDVQRVMALFNGGQQQPTATPAPAPQPSTPPMPQNSGEDDDDNSAPDANAPDRDSSGTPWDERIHAKSKKTNADGTFRKKRGISDDYFKQVTEELKSQPAPAPQLAQAPAPQPEVSQPNASVPMPEQQPAPMPQQQQPAPQPAPQPMPQPMPEQQQPAPQPAPQPMPQPMPEQQQQPAPQPAQSQQGGTPFEQFMTKLRGGMERQDANGAYLVDQNYIQTICQEIGNAYQTPINAITDIHDKPHMIEYATQILQRDGKIS